MLFAIYFPCSLVQKSVGKGLMKSYQNSVDKVEPTTTYTLAEGNSVNHRINSLKKTQNLASFL